MLLFALSNLRIPEDSVDASRPQIQLLVAVAAFVVLVDAVAVGGAGFEVRAPAQYAWVQIVYGISFHPRRVVAQALAVALPPSMVLEVVVRLRTASESFVHHHYDVRRTEMRYCIL